MRGNYCWFCGSLLSLDEKEKYEQECDKCTERIKIHGEPSISELGVKHGKKVRDR